MKGKHMRCDRHGRIAWELTIVCGGCGRFYQIAPDGTPFKPLCKGSTQAPERCECGKRLAPEAGVQGGGIFWARSCCTECFRNKVMAKDTVVMQHDQPVEVSSAEEIVDHIIKTTTG